MLDRLNHVALVVPDLGAAIDRYAQSLGAIVSAPQPLPEHGVTVAFVDLGNSKVELMEPLGPDSPVAAFLQKNPRGGMHHVCYEVADIAETCARLRRDGARILGEPRLGAHGRPVIFIHPGDMFGTLIELEEV